MRVAIALSGEMRGKDECLRLLQERVIQPFLDVGATVDLFCHTRKDDWWTPAGKLPFRCLWVEENRKRDDSLIVSSANPRERGDRKGNDRRAFLYQSYMQQYWSLQATHDMISRAEQQDRQLYDIIVRSRPDVYLEAPLPIDELVRENVVYVPWNDWWPYDIDGKRFETCNDKFAVGPGNSMLGYLNKIERLAEFCVNHPIQGEAFTAWQLNKCGVRWHRHDKIKCIQADNPYAQSLRPDA